MIPNTAPGTPAPAQRLRIMVCAPGHSFSTIDVFNGLCVGLQMHGITVVPFHWDKPLEILATITNAAVAHGGLSGGKAEAAMQFATWLASADILNVAIDHEVDAVIVVNGLLIPPSRMQVLRRLGIPVVCYGTEAPYFLRAEQDIAPFYTHWFTNERACVDAFADKTRAYYLPHAYNPALHRPGAADPTKAVDAVFIGGGYPERRALLDGMGVTTRGTLWHLDMDAERNTTDPQRRTRYAEGAIPNIETTAWHRSAKVALNLHRRMTYVETGDTIPAGSAESLGPRAYEIPAVGGFMLCDDERPEIHDVYGESAATFRAWDRADLAYRLRYWLTHDDARERQQRAQADAVRPHHWGARAKQIMEHIL